jgi:hypothetical protein
MRFEHFSQPVLPFKKWLKRVCKTVWLAAMIAGTALGIGIAGYMVLGHLPLVDAILEASMILAGMGPVAPMNSVAAKLFASGYALLSGLVVISTTALILAPWLHRMLHYFYRERQGGESRKNGGK